MSENNSESVVQIDEHNLDKECIRLPAQYLKYAHQAADAKRDVAEAEASLSIVEAELAKKIRATPEVYGIEKITESAIKAAIETRESFKLASEKVRKVRYQSDLSQAVVWALETKKRSLTLLVDLHGMGYFSSPKVTKAGRAAVEEMSQRRLKRED